MTNAAGVVQDVGVLALHGGFYYGFGDLALRLGSSQDPLGFLSWSIAIITTAVCSTTAVSLSVTS